MRRFVNLLIAISVCLATSAWAGDFEDGLAAYKIGDYQTAVRLWRQAANQGGASAQYNLGIMYMFGRGDLR